MTLIVIPWRDTGTHRSAACLLVCEALRAVLPGTPLLLADSGHTPFNRAASRNLGAAKADPNEVLVVSDADVIPEEHWYPAAQPLAAIVDAARDGNLHYPFTTCRYLSQEATADVLRGKPPDGTNLEFEIPAAQGGLMVMLAGAWHTAGGMDERFTGWGYEDNDWHTRVSRTIGPPAHHPGVLWHLWHPAARYRWTDDEINNLALCKLDVARHQPPPP